MSDPKAAITLDTFDWSHVFQTLNRAACQTRDQKAARKYAGAAKAINAAYLSVVVGEFVTVELRASWRAEIGRLLRSDRANPRPGLASRIDGKPAHEDSAEVKNAAKEVRERIRKGEFDV